MEIQDEKKICDGGDVCVERSKERGVIQQMIENSKGVVDRKHC